VTVKQWSKVPRDFWQLIEKTVELMGYGDDIKTDQYSLNSINTLQIDLLGLQSEHYHTTDSVLQLAELLLDEVWAKQDARRPKIYISRRRISTVIAPTLFTETEDGKLLD
jgi:hypothetical protein